jgi:diguanylate cyclase (GGDEF)-like protein
VDQSSARQFLVVPPEPVDSYSEDASAPIWSRPDPALAAAGIEGETVVARVRLLAMGLLLLAPTWNILHDPTRGVYITGFIITLTAAIASLIIFIALRRGRWRPWIGFASSAFDVTMVSSALVSFMIVASPLFALNSNVTFEMYFLAILATSLRYDGRICIVIGALAALQYGGMWLYASLAYDLHDPSYAVGVGSYDPVDLATRLILLGVATLLAYTIVRRAQRLLYLAARDRLTGLFNRGHLDRSLSGAMESAARAGQPLSLAILDIDHFKSINDRFGHAQGDLALVTIARQLAREMRRTDMVARYGGEEFVILLPGTPRDAALARMEGLRREVSETPIDLGNGNLLKINFSAGIAGTPDDVDAISADTLLGCADARLLHAKRTGRGRCVGAGECAVPGGTIESQGQTRG